MAKRRNFVLWFDENDKLAGWEFADGEIWRYPQEKWGTPIEWTNNIIPGIPPVYVGMDRRNYPGTVGPSKAASSDRSFPPDNGTVDGKPASIEQDGKRTVAYSGPEKVGKVVTNDGENASYLRNDDGTPVLDDNAVDPYNPPPWNRH